MQHAIIAFVDFLHAGEAVALLEGFFDGAAALNALYFSDPVEGKCFIEESVEGMIVERVFNGSGVFGRHFFE